MKTRCRILLLFAALTIVSLAHAHPGHDDHEFTWELSHLAAHPWATLACLAVLGAAAWGGWLAVRHLGAAKKRDTK